MVIRTIAALGSFFAWIFLVLLIHEIDIRPIEVITVKSPVVNWYQVGVKYTGTEIETALFDYQKKEKIVDLFALTELEASETFNLRFNIGTPQDAYIDSIFLFGD